MRDKQSIVVSIDYYVAAERNVSAIRSPQSMAKGVNRFTHARVPIRLDRQSAPRMNRDTM